MGYFYLFLLAVVCSPLILFVYRRKVSVASSLVALIALGGVMSGCVVQQQMDVASAMDVDNDNGNDDKDVSSDDDEDDEELEIVNGQPVRPAHVTVYGSPTPLRSEEAEDNAEAMGYRVRCERTLAWGSSYGCF